MNSLATSTDPSITALQKFYKTRETFERYLKQSETDDAEIDRWHDRYERDLEAVTSTVPTTLEGFKAAIEELCYQAQQGFSSEAVSRWLATFCDGVWGYAHVRTRAKSLSDAR